jgi:hypothetical protein
MPEMSLPACEAACARLCLDFANGIDARDHERCANVFATDAVFDHVTGRIEGRAGVMSMLASRPTNMVIRHLCTNIDITPTGPTTATGRCYTAVLRTTSEDGKLPVAPVLPLMVEYHDEYALVEGRWTIIYRKTVPIFA